VGSPFSVVFSIKVPDHIQNPAGGTLPVTSIEIATSGAVTNIPASFSYACNPSDCVFPANTTSCVALTGTPQPGEEGVYDLKVNAIIHSIIPIAIVIPDDLGPGNYFLNVRAANDPGCMPSATQGIPWTRLKTLYREP
jgi:hypothetical protein